ncbi:MAG TPA: hypothetical protein VKA65_11195 [Acidimicrobiales bacterium]|nr:hypothetical protein [Acidimicrobiales bacterium]
MNPTERSTPRGREAAVLPDAVGRPTWEVVTDSGTISVMADPERHEFCLLSAAWR